jgi:hypothetical protein
MIIRSPRLWPGKFVVDAAKRVLQQHDVNVWLAGQATGNARGPLRGLIESQPTDLSSKRQRS